MNALNPQWVRHSLATAALALLAGCGTDASFGPLSDSEGALPAARAVALGSCPDIAAPAGSVLAFRAYARGYQIYRWTGTAWTLNGPSATLYADAGGRGLVGTHSAGPRWDFNGGGRVFGSLNRRCDVEPANIPWLLLDARSEGPGVFHGVTHIQRVNTAGGPAPAAPGTQVGELRSVYYTAEYYFYRAP